MYSPNILRFFGSVFILIISRLSNVYTSSATVDWTTSSLELEQYFMKNIIRANVRETCSDLSRNEKLAICDYIFSHPMLKSKYGQRVYLNKSVSWVSAFECSSELLLFNYSHNYNNAEKDPVKKELFSCPGRHEPLRTNPITDDALFYFYVGRGATEKEYFIFSFHKTVIIDDVYYFLAYRINNLNVGELFVPIIQEEDTNQEVRSLERLSRNSAVEEIEISYRRENKYKEDSDYTICDLTLEQKISACQLIISHSSVPLQATESNENAFINESNVCVTKYLNFKYIMPQEEESKEMICCHCLSNTDSKPLYLSDGYRNSSLLVFVDSDNNDKITSDKSFVQFYEFYENVIIPDKLSDQTVDNASSTLANQMQPGEGNAIESLNLPNQELRENSKNADKPVDLPDKKQLSDERTVSKPTIPIDNNQRNMYASGVSFNCSPAL